MFLDFMSPSHFLRKKMKNYQFTTVLASLSISHCFSVKTIALVKKNRISYQRHQEFLKFLNKGPSINYDVSKSATSDPLPALCVEMGFTWTFSWDQDATVKLKSEIISIKI